jgi:hypothetical protein
MAITLPPLTQMAVVYSEQLSLHSKIQDFPQKILFISMHMQPLLLLAILQKPMRSERRSVLMQIMLQYLQLSR